MQENDLSKIEKDLQQIADMLLLNGTLIECPGLVNGKMGIAVFDQRTTSNQKQWELYFPSE